MTIDRVDAEAKADERESEDGKVGTEEDTGEETTTGTEDWEELVRDCERLRRGEIGATMVDVVTAVKGPLPAVTATVEVISAEESGETTAYGEEVGDDSGLGFNGGELDS